jgi:phosphoribosyl-ATP pyrophosphohydrolase
LLYHVAVLLHARDLGWEDVIAVLRQRHQARAPDARFPRQPRKAP